MGGSEEGTPVDLIMQVWNGMDAPLHRQIFAEQWLPATLAPADAAQVVDLQPGYLLELYPHIFRYGPNYLSFVATLPDFHDRVVADLTTAHKPLLTTLAELEYAFSEAYNDDDSYDLLKNNADYVYRNTTTQTADDELIPGYAPLAHIPGLHAWLKTYESPQNAAINEWIIISTYKDFYLNLDVFDRLPPFEHMVAKFRRLLTDYKLG